MVSKQAIESLHRCEAELRALVGQAARDGDYNVVMQLTRWAQKLAELTAEPVGGAVQGPLTATPAAVPSKARKKYPVFCRSQDSLIKIGWSAKSRSEYEHRAPLELVQQLAAAAQRIGARGRLFQLGTLAKAAHGDTATPGYQLYVVVAWWRDVGLIDQHGRKGYSISKAATFTSDVERAFAQLVSRKD